MLSTTVRFSLLGSLTVLCLAFALTADAQILVPPAPAPIVVPRPLPYDLQKKPDRWSARGEISYVATGGNTDTSSAKLAAEVEYKPAAWGLLVRGAFLTTTSETGDRNKRVDGLARASRAISTNVDLFGQLVYLENTFAGINSSFYPLAGVSYEVFSSPMHTLTARMGLGYGQESRVREPDASFATADSEIGYRWRVSTTAELRQDTTFTANLNQTDDWRAASVSSMSAALNALFSLKVSLVASYLNAPVEGFGRVDTITSAALVATF